MSNFNNDILFVTKRLGNPSDPYVALSETKVINNGMIVLKEVPDIFSGITITGASKTWVEVKNQNTTLTTGQFYSDYKNGYLYFSSADNNLSVTINYMGTGGLYVADTRVVSLDSSGNITQTLQDWVNTAQAPVNNFTSTIGAYDNTKSYLINNIVNWNGAFYVCVQNTTGNSPTLNTNNAYWNYWMGVNTQLSTLRNEVTINNAVSSVSVGISAYNSNNDLLFVHKNSTYLQQGTDYNISGGTITPINTTWDGTSAPLVFDFLVLKNTISTVPTGDGSLLQAGSVGNTQLAPDAKVGSLPGLLTVAKDSAVNAINENVNKINVLSQNQGSLSALNTSDKTSVVNAINSNFNQFGSLSGSLTKQNYFHPSKRRTGSLTELAYRNKNMDNAIPGAQVLVNGAWVAPTYDKPYKLLFIGDSIFERIRVPFIEYLMENHEVNALGFSPLDVTDRQLFSGKNENIVTSGITTDTDDATSDATWGIAGRSHNGSTGATIQYQTYAPFIFTDCKIFFLNNPGNGSFQYNVDGGSWTTVNTNQIYGLSYVTISNLVPTTHTVNIQVTSGTVTFYGIYTSRENNRGIIPSFINKGGTLCQQWAQRMTFPTQFIQAIGGVDQFNILLGANDITVATPSRTPAQFQTDLTTVISALNPSLMQDVVLFTYTQRATQSSPGVYDVPDAVNMPMFQSYMTVLQQMAQANDYSIFDMYELLPDRSVAWSNGLYADQVHLSDVGGMFVGMFMADALIPKAISTQYLKNSYQEIKWNAPFPYRVESIATGVTTGGANEFIPGVLTIDNRILLAPSAPDTTLLLNLIDNSFYKKYKANFHGFSASVTAPNGLVYFIPYNADYIGVYDPVTDTLGQIPVPSSITGMLYKFTGGVLAPNGKIYCIPYAAQYVMTIDTNNNNALGTSIASTLSSLQFEGGVLAPNGKIYAGGVVDNKLMVVDPSNDSISYVAYTNTNSSQFGAGCVASTGKVYFSAKNGKEIMKLDPSSNTITLLLNGSFSASGAMVAAPDGYLYIMDNGASPSVKVYDPTTDTIIQTISVSAYGTTWKGGVYAPNGKIYFIPLNSTNLISITTGLPKYQSKYFESPYFNKY